MKENQEQLQERFLKLPEELQNAIVSEESLNNLQKIDSKYALRKDQAGELGSETGFVLLGLTHPKDFVAHLKTRLGVTDEIAKAIGQDVNEQIFRGVRESLRKIHGITDEVHETKPAEKILEETLNAAPKPILQKEPPPPKTAEKILEETFSRPIKTAPPPTNLPTGDFSDFAKSEKSPVLTSSIESKPIPKMETPMSIKEKPMIGEVSFIPSKKPEIGETSNSLLPQEGEWDFPKEKNEQLSKENILRSIENPRDQREKSEEKIVKTEIPLPPPPPSPIKRTSPPNATASVSPIPKVEQPIVTESKIPTSSIPSTPVVPEKKIVKEYSADPYREAI